MEDEKLIDNAREVGAYLLDELHKLPGIKEIRGRGLMIGIEFEDRSRKYAASCCSKRRYLRE